MIDTREDKKGNAWIWILISFVIVTTLIVTIFMVCVRKRRQAGIY
jgi:flagellar basal body-associated protein FliL